MSKSKPSPVPVAASNKFRSAIEVLQRGRDLLMDELAETVLDQADELLEGGFAFHEFLENQGTRVHFLCLLLSQLEQSAEAAEEAQVEALTPLFEFELEGAVEPAGSTDDPAPAKPAARKRKSRAKPKGGKKLAQQSPTESTPDEL